MAEKTAEERQKQQEKVRRFLDVTRGRGMSQAEAGGKIDADQTIISRWEKWTDGKREWQDLSPTTERAIDDYLLSGPQLPGYRDGVRVALDAVRATIDDLQIRIDASISEREGAAADARGHGPGRKSGKRKAGGHDPR